MNSFISLRHVFMNYEKLSYHTAYYSAYAAHSIAHSVILHFGFLERLGTKKASTAKIIPVFIFVG